MRRRVRGAGDHPVGEPQVHHEGAEVGHVRHAVRGLRVGDALVCADALVLLREPVDVGRVERAQDLRGLQVDAELTGAGADIGLLAEDRDVGDPAGEDRGGGTEDAVIRPLRQHDPLALRAGAFDQLELEHQGRDDVGARDADPPQQVGRVDALLEEGQRRVVATLRVGGEASARRHDAPGRLVRVEVGGEDRQGRLEAVDEPVDRLGQRERAVQRDRGDRRERARGVGEQRREQHVGAVGGDRDDRALLQARQHVVQRHARHDDVQHLAGQEFLVALEQRGIQGPHDVADGRCDEVLVLGNRPHADVGADVRGCDGGDVLDDLGAEGREAAVDDDGEQACPLVRHLGEREGREVADLLRGPPAGLADVVALRGLPGQDEQDGGAEVRGDARVVAELRGAADVRVVAADDDDGIALRLDGLVAFDDLPEGGIRVGADLVVGRADALVVAEVDAVVVEQHLQDVVALGRGPGDRAEDADARRRVAERVEHAERDRGLPGMTLGRRDVDALCHSPSLGRGRRRRPGGHRGKETPGGKVRLSANPTEPGYPCYVSVLGELAEMPPRGELRQV
ncbi:hypothetical protein MIPYR_80031 [uncultured Microbacterium sp.]|uniref:Uncharacterized protein n=1 Tax=uncultured Microbacterium sp. TaxID=191216 RepID=A0A1Y5P848_9MICO|nr:hypothetical protein MIPYR_80031 [uncultured Microbacterium sp.]